MRIAILMFCGAAWCLAQTPITSPSIGKMIDSAGSRRAVYGVAGNFTVSTRERGLVISSACSGTLCLAKTSDRLWGLKTGRLSPKGPALFALDGEEAIIYFPATNAFARWRSGRLTGLPWQVEGEVLALRQANRNLEIAVRRGEDVLIVRPDGSVLDYLGELNGPVALLPGGVLLTIEDKLILQRVKEKPLEFELVDVQSFSALGEEYVQVNAAGVSYALRVTPGREQLFILPVPPPDPEPLGESRMTHRQEETHAR